MSQEEVKSIYKKILIQREQSRQRVKDEMNNTLTGKLNHTFDQFMEAMRNPKISKLQFDTLIKNMDNTLDILIMNTDHDVIMALTNNLISQKYKDKITKS